MSYTIIGQNNSVTTVDDGNGHILHIPSRVSLAIGTTFTITEVNNNMATLTDSNGKVYRDIPCVVDLVGSGGGGGAVDSVNGKTGAVVITSADVLPSQTGNAGKFLTTDGTDASWSDKPLVNKSNKTNALAVGNNTAAGSHTTCIGQASYNSLATYGVAVGYNASIAGAGSVAIGANAHASGTNSIQISSDGDAQVYNNDANTFKVANDNGNFEIMSADGTIPTARLTKVNTTATLTSAGWSGGSQTITVNGITATGVVFVSPDPTDQSAYTSAGIICTAQATDSLTFTCTSTPSADLTVNVVML